MSPPELEICVQTQLASFELKVDQTLPAQGVTAIFGASGSGKTTLLNLISGFLRPGQGHVRFGDLVWSDSQTRSWVPPHKRGVGFLFQEGRLFPHYSVHGNLEYADRRSHHSEINYTFDDVISAIDLGALLDRAPTTLSGGERQRVALARTLLSRPRLLLLDEPLSALDTHRKAELLPYLEDLQSQFAIPTLYVSHDVNEVSRIAERTLMLEAGKVAGFGPTSQILARAGLEAGRNPFETASMIEGTLTQAEDDHGLSAVRIGEEMIWLAVGQMGSEAQPVKIKIAARDVAFALARPEGLSIQNALSASITDIQESSDPAFCMLQLVIAGQSLAARITRKSLIELDLKPGTEGFALIKSASLQR
ncbi:MAG: molybdenum ABC transporter ATP-binding protein [Pseudomonadota bacterium]